jgi:hypothetical protein
MQKVRVLAVLAAIAASPAAFAGTINVPGDYPTIQQAIDAAVAGDLVIVAKGKFTENIDLKGKAITLQGAGRVGGAGPRTTLINGGGGGGPCVTIAMGEQGTTLITGFDIRSGTGKVVGSKRLGGGIYISGASSPTINDCGIGFNTADLGAGVYIDLNCNPTFFDCLIANNVTANKGTGGGVYSLGNPTFDNCRIAENTATNGTGGGVYLENATTASITNSEIDKNHAFYGGGVHVNGGTPLIANNVFEQNEVIKAPINGEGGGLGVVGKGTPLVTRNDFRFNEAHTGAGIYTYDASPDITLNLIHENTASQTSSGFGYGGGIAMGRSGGSVQLNEIYFNTAMFGGGTAFRSRSNTAVTGNLIDHNQAAPFSGGVGGGTYSKDSEPFILANTYGENEASNGGGLFITSGTLAPTIDNTIVWGNKAGSNISYFDGTSGGLVVTFSDIEAQVVGGSNFSIDPLLVDPANRNYRLQSGSPMVDAGNFIFNGPPNDVYGNTRINNGRVDVGASEQ